MPTAAPAPLPLRDLRRALMTGPVALAALALVTLDLPAMAHAGAVLHEAMHDGRHVLGVPCH